MINEAPAASLASLIMTVLETSCEVLGRLYASPAPALPWGTARLGHGLGTPWHCTCCHFPISADIEVLRHWCARHSSEPCLQAVCVTVPSVIVILRVTSCGWSASSFFSDGAVLCLTAMSLTAMSTHRSLQCKLYQRLLPLAGWSMSCDTVTATYCRPYIA